MECLQQEECLRCFHKHPWAHKSKKEKAKALHAIAALPKFKFDADPLDKLTKVLVAIYKICEMDDAVTMLTRASNPEHNSMFGEGLETVKAILQVTLYGCTANTSQVRGEAVDFIVTARALIAMLKGFTMGIFGEDDADFFTYHATELKSKSKVSFEKAKLSWAKAALLLPKEKFSFDAPDAVNMLKQCWDHLTVLLTKTLGLQIAMEHAEVCNVLMAAHMGEEFPQVEFTVIMIYLMHRSTIDWWRACMKAFLSKSTYLHSNFGNDLIWVGQGTSFKRPRLLIGPSRMEGMSGLFSWTVDSSEWSDSTERQQHLQQRRSKLS